MKKIPFFHAFLIVGVLALALDCTCGWAAVKPAPKAMAHCHEHENGQQDPFKCCGKCQIEKSAITSETDLTRLSASQTRPSDLYVLTSGKPVLDKFHFLESPVFETGQTFFTSPGHSQAAPRSPPR